MPELMAYTLIISVLWFVIFWILGGVFFAVVSLARTVKLRKARFSCLFTILSGVAAYGAAQTGMRLGAKRIRFCLGEADGSIVDVLSAIFGCGILEMLAAGAAWFFGLVILGFVVLYICRAQNDSWVDSDLGLDKAEPVRLEDMKRTDIAL
jgi:hypothetical protein